MTARGGHRFHLLDPLSLLLQAHSATSSKFPFLPDVFEETKIALCYCPPPSSSYDRQCIFPRSFSMSTQLATARGCTTHHPWTSGPCSCRTPTQPKVPGKLPLEQPIGIGGRTVPRRSEIIVQISITIPEVVCVCRQQLVGQNVHVIYCWLKRCVNHVIAGWLKRCVSGPVMIRRTARLLNPLEEGMITTSGDTRQRSLVPRAPVGPSPSENANMTTSGSTGARSRIPTQPLDRAHWRTSRFPPPAAM